MRKIIVTLLFLTPFLAACTNVDTTITIDKNNSASVLVENKYDGNLSSMEDINALAIMSNYSKFLDKDYTVKEDFSNDSSVITASKSVQNLIDEDLNLSSLGFTTNLPSGRFIEIRKNWIAKSVNINLNYDLKKVSQQYENIIPTYEAKKASDNVMTPEYFQQDKDLVKIAQQEASSEVADEVIKKNTQDKPKVGINIKLPATAFYNNADSVNGNTYTWYLKDTEVNNIKIQYIKYNIFLIVIGFGFILGLLGLLAFKIKRSDSQKRPDNIKGIV